MLMIFFHLIVYFIKTHGELNQLKNHHIIYLQNNGYLPKYGNKSSGKVFKNFELLNALKKFQEFAGLPTTGVLDSITVKKFNQPRCGIEDKFSNLRPKRYVTQGGKWHKKLLTFQILNYSNDLSKDQIDKTIKDAFHKWEAVSRLKFTERPNGIADIKIKFTRSNHGDPYPFDGPGGTLAHAFYPGSHDLSGDIHFDDDELFTLNTMEGKDLSWVVLHELGHSLGLEHSHEKGAIMYPWYERHDGREIVLHEDDIEGIQFLYGIPDNEKHSHDKNQPIRCVEKIDAVTIDQRGYVIVISKGFVYTFDNQLDLAEQPISIHAKFNNIKEIDVSFTKINGHIIYIHADKFWEYNGDRLIKGPIPTKNIGFTADMVNLDGAVRWHLNKRVYFFKGNKYWRFNEKTYRIDPDYPKLIRDFWIGVPDNIDGVFEWTNNYLYFFKGLNYYRFDNKRLMVADGYPLTFQDKFFRCNEKLSLGPYTSASQHLSFNLFGFFIWLILHLN
ncbi:collagenase 3 isoform X2 [Hydra vulgaris]|uniref:Collagenase 3 isoform X2 n=1 Tax=Hydra vulgaris TaxID=6087 RepID=A0ABM4D5M6_HYDVU